MSISTKEQKEAAVHKWRLAEIFKRTREINQLGFVAHIMPVVAKIEEQREVVVKLIRFLVGRYELENYITINWGEK